MLGVPPVNPSLTTSGTRTTVWETLVYNNNKLLPFCPVPIFFGVKLDRSLTFRHYFVALL